MRKFAPFWEKNAAEMRAIFSGKMWSRIKKGNNSKGQELLPVFTFHTVKPVQFENQLKHLSSNGYHTVDANHLLGIFNGEERSSERAVAITFDDATGSFWSTAFPLLQKYNAKAILFAIPGIVPDDRSYYPNLADVWAGKSAINAIANREKIKPLCTWSELCRMHKSGYVDIQSHSLTHSRINIDPTVVDFVNPEFDTYFYENINIPISIFDSTERPERKAYMGAPVYKSASRLSGIPRYLEDPRVQNEMISYVADNGAEALFADSSWRERLHNQLSGIHTKSNIKYETNEEMMSQIKREFKGSKELLENHLTGKEVRHFCYPWFQGSSTADKIAGECGYKSVFYGYESLKKGYHGHKFPKRVHRIADEYLFCLPGVGRKSILRVILEKFIKRIKN